MYIIVERYYAHIISFIYLLLSIRDVLKYEYATNRKYLIMFIIYSDRSIVWSQACATASEWVAITTVAP